MDIKDLAKENNIEHIVIFGSQVDGSQRQDSDFDIAVYCNKFNNLDSYTKVLFGLADVLKISSDKIDLTNLKYADPILRYEITSKGKLLYGNECDYLEFCAFAFRDYIDSKDLFDLRYLMLKRKNKKLQEYVK